MGLSRLIVFGSVRCYRNGYQFQLLAQALKRPQIIHLVFQLAPKAFYWTIIDTAAYTGHTVTHTFF